ncbi:MAG: tryptophan synthase subunit beta [Spirochaetes bacterium]|nr:tryptophan synthase subunit beta [Spirochaetota bacterium]
MRARSLVDGYSKQEVGNNPPILTGFFGSFGGRYVAEVLRKPLHELEEAFLSIVPSKEFQEEYQAKLKSFVGRPTPLYYAENTTRLLGGGRLYIKLEGLAATGAHKINNALGQGLLAKRMGKKRVIAETGAGQHGVAVAAVCAHLGIPCRVYMGEVDMMRQKPNVFWMERYGAEVVGVSSGSRTLKDAVNEALRDWASHPEDTFYILGSALGPSPYPDMVRTFQSIIGVETKEQLASLGLKPTALIACVGGGSNAIGFFSPYLYPIDESEERIKGTETSNMPRLIGVEAGGRGPGKGQHAARMSGEGKVGIVQGYKSRFLLDEDGQVLPTHSVSAGLDYPGIGPELAYLGDRGRIEFITATDRQAIEAMDFFARTEGILFALESAHGGAAALRLLPSFSKEAVVVVNMSGRGDKDLFITARELDRERWREFLQREVDSLGDAL